MHLQYLSRCPRFPMMTMNAIWKGKKEIKTNKEEQNVYECYVAFNIDGAFSQSNDGLINCALHLQHTVNGLTGCCLRQDTDKDEDDVVQRRRQDIR